MVNTVGSCENKFWHKKWVSIKQHAYLTKQQHELIVGSLLGDGTMRVGHDAVNANFKVEHGLAQKEYVEWKYDILKPLVFTEPKISYRYKENGEKYQKSWWFRTIRHPFLTTIHRRFYKDGVKIVPKDIEKDLNPLMLAVWVMDDGSYMKGKLDISTYSFSLQEIILLLKCLKKVFDFNTKYYRDRDKGYRIYWNKKETEKIIHVIAPHIIPSMEYKIGFR